MRAQADLRSQNEQFRQAHAELEKENEQIQKTQEELLRRNERVKEAQRDDQLWAKNLQEENMKLLAADLEKVKLIHQYQDQQAALQQELLQYKYEVERVKRARDSLTMSGARVSEIPIHETSVGSQMESHHGSSVHSKGVPPVIDAHPIQQTTPGRRFQFMATDKAPGSVASQAKGASQGRPLKETDGTGNTYLLGQTLNSYYKLPIRGLHHRLRKELSNVELRLLQRMPLSVFIIHLAPVIQWPRSWSVGFPAVLALQL